MLLCCEFAFCKSIRHSTGYNEIDHFNTQCMCVRVKSLCMRYSLAGLRLNLWRDTFCCTPQHKIFCFFGACVIPHPGNICNTRTTSQFPQTNFLYYFYFLLFVRRQVFHCGYYSYPGDDGMFPAFLCIYFQNSFWYALKICKFWEYGKIWNCCRNSRQCSPLANQVYDVCLVFMSSKCAA